MSDLVEENDQTIAVYNKRKKNKKSKYISLKRNKNTNLNFFKILGIILIVTICLGLLISIYNYTSSRLKKPEQVQPEHETFEDKSLPQITPELITPNTNLTENYTFSPNVINNSIPPEKFELDVLEKLTVRHEAFNDDFSFLCQNSLTDKQFLNGIVRKYRPKKCLEVGVLHGCTSSIILNAILDIDGAFLSSIDIMNERYNLKTGHFVDNFPELKTKWKLYTGGQTYKFIEQIGGGIEFIFLDTEHVLPGETLDILQMLPFFAENAILILHDINYGWIPEYHHIRTTNTLLFTYLKGEKILPESHEKDYYIHPMGAVILEKNQKKYYFDYFFAMGIHWQNLPSEQIYNEILLFFSKYYEQKYIDLFKSAYKAHKLAKTSYKW